MDFFMDSKGGNYCCELHRPRPHGTAWIDGGYRLIPSHDLIGSVKCETCGAHPLLAAVSTGAPRIGLDVRRDLG